jgi:hypothetical protein
MSWIGHAIRWDIQDGFYSFRHIYPELLPDIHVSWWPPGEPYLRYQRLYRGIYEFLREEPNHAFRSRALRYLRSLKACYHPINSSVLQWHRIVWTEAWLDELGDVDSDADTVVGEDE